MTFNIIGRILACEERHHKIPTSGITSCVMFNRPPVEPGRCVGGADHRELKFPQFMLIEKQSSRSVLFSALFFCL